MTRRSLAVWMAAFFSAFLAMAAASAQGQPGHEPPGAPRALPRPPSVPNPHGGPMQAGERARAGAEHGAPAGHGPAGGHAAHAEHDEKAPPPPINWWHGLLGPKEGVHPNLLWRDPEEPPPYLAQVLNFGLLVFIVVKFGKKPLRDALVKRKDNIVRELEEAQRLHEAAEKRLAQYEAKLDKIQEDLERIRGEFREQGELEKQRILTEARERRDRMKRDAEVLLSQEVKQMRQELVVEVVREATQLATELLSKEMTLGDHDRFAEGFLAELRSGSKARGFGAVAASAAAKGSAS
jgi:F-type H+-transporting ATPase subunit b